MILQRPRLAEIARRAPPYFVRDARLLPVAITADTLRDTLRARDTPALVHCMASWAAPCRAQSVEIEALARSSGWRFGMFTLDVHLEPEAAAYFAVRVLPTVLVLHRDRVIERFTGFQDAARLRSALIAAEYPGEAAEVRLAS